MLLLFQDHKSFISSLNVLFSKDHDDFCSWYCISKLHKNPYNTTNASTFSKIVIVYKYGLQFDWYQRENAIILEQSLLT